MALILLLAGYGITFFLIDSYLFKSIRDWLCQYRIMSELFKCYFCTGFWCSVTLSALYKSNLLVTSDLKTLFKTLIVDGFAGASFSYGYNTLLEALESYYDNHSKKT